nr:DUF4190 domain-containing protein [Micromonospora sp. DSM 115978]
MTPTSGKATLALILGVVSIIGGGCLLLPAVATVVVGHMATRETRTGQRAGHGLAVTALVLGYLCLAGWAAFGTMMLIGAITPPPQ